MLIFILFPKLHSRRSQCHVKAGYFKGKNLKFKSLVTSPRVDGGSAQQCGFAARGERRCECDRLGGAGVCVSGCEASEDRSASSASLHMEGACSHLLQDVSCEMRCVGTAQWS